MIDRVLPVAFVSLCLAQAASAQSPPQPASPRVEQATGPWSALPIVPAKGAQAVVAAAQAEAAQNRWAMSIAVVDPGGRLVSFVRMDGAPLGTIDVAQGKALTAIKFKMPTKTVQAMVDRAGPALTTLPDIVAVTGGYPIVVNGQVVGAVGVSGGFGDEDDRAAQAGLGALSQ